MRAIEQSTVLITGATDGLGKAVATELAGLGARVLVHGRDDERGRQTLGEIRSATGSDRLAWYRADFASLAEVRALAEQVASCEERLDVLVNNAGIGFTLPGGGARLESKDGYELRFAVNYLAPFLLTHLLLDLLVQSARSRVVNVSSLGQAPVDFGDVMLERSYDGTHAYCQSKLALIMFTFDLAATLQGTGVTVNALHPGTFMPTKMVLDADVKPVDTLEQGVRSTMQLIVEPALEGVTGRFFDHLEESKAKEQAYDAAARRLLRELSEELVGLGTATRR